MLDTTLVVNGTSNKLSSMTTSPFHRAGTAQELMRTTADTGGGSHALHEDRSRSIPRSDTSARGPRRELGGAQRRPFRPSTEKVGCVHPDVVI